MTEVDRKWENSFWNYVFVDTKFSLSLSRNLNKWRWEYNFQKYQLWFKTMSIQFAELRITMFWSKLMTKKHKSDFFFFFTKKGVKCMSLFLPTEVWMTQHQYIRMSYWLHVSICTYCCYELWTIHTHQSHVIGKIVTRKKKIAINIAIIWTTNKKFNSNLWCS